LRASVALLDAFNPDKMSLDAHADQFFAAAEVGAFGVDPKRYDALKRDRFEGRGGWGARVRHPEDQTFCRQVLYGVVRYEKFLDAFVSAFYRTRAGSLLRKDKTETTVCAYLGLLRLDELGFSAFAAVVAAHSSGPRFAVPFLKFAFDTDGLRTLDVVRRWREAYDGAWVENVLGFLDASGGEAETLSARFEKELDGLAGSTEEDASFSDSESLERATDDASDASSSRGDAFADAFGETNPTRTRTRKTRKTRKTQTLLEKRRNRPPSSAATVPEPFNIRPSRPRPAAPVPVAPKPFTANPVPSSTRRVGPTPEALAVSEAAAKSRERSRRKYSDETLVFTLRAVERPTNIDAVRLEMETERRDALEAIQNAAVPIAKPVPRSNAPGYVGRRGPVKMNAAFVFRANAELMKRRDLETEAIEGFERGLRDGSEYDAWREKKRDEDAFETARRKETIRMETTRSREEARKVRESRARENADRGCFTRDERELLKKRREEDASRAFERARARREAIESTRVNVETARRASRLERKKRAAAAAEERRTTAALLAAMQKKELEAKRSRVRQIRAFEEHLEDARGELEVEANATLFERSKTKDVRDAEETVSLFESRERLAAAAERSAAAERKRREAIRDRRERRRAFLNEKLLEFQAYQSRASDASKRRKEARGAEEKNRREETLQKIEKDRFAAEATSASLRLEKERLAQRRTARAEAETFARWTRVVADVSGAESSKRASSRAGMGMGTSRPPPLGDSSARNETFRDAKSRAAESRVAKRRTETERAKKSAFESMYDEKLREAGVADETMRREDAAKATREAFERMRTGSGGTETETETETVPRRPPTSPRLVGGTRETMLDAPAAARGVARTTAE
jgi:hypothetical protein